jgi:uncharacterized protein YbjT (DUF2867 family)
VITSNADRVKEIEALGAKALVGSLQDQAFLNSAFKGADVVYTMIPPIWQTTNWRASQLEISKSYAEAIRANGVKYIVNLSSIGAHEPNGVGPVSGLYDFEQLLNNISGLHVKHLRPSFFYFNFLALIGLIKHAGIMGANYGGSEKIFLVHPKDIAAAGLDELLKLNFTGSSIRYVIGDERSGQEIATVLGKSIGKDLNWVEFTDDQQKQGLLGAGLPETHATGYTEMGNALRTGLMQADARKKKPALSAIKLEDFAKEFAAAFKA